MIVDLCCGSRGDLQILRILLDANRKRLIVYGGTYAAAWPVAAKESVHVFRVFQHGPGSQTNGGYKDKISCGGTELYGQLFDSVGYPMPQHHSTHQNPAAGSPAALWTRAAVPAQSHGPERYRWASVLRQIRPYQIRSCL
jgi:hypothetical protein